MNAQHGMLRIDGLRWFRSQPVERGKHHPDLQQRWPLSANALPGMERLKKSDQQRFHWQDNPNSVIGDNSTICATYAGN